jgi:hypothetical protein
VGVIEEGDTDVGTTVGNADVGTALEGAAVGLAEVGTGVDGKIVGGTVGGSVGVKVGEGVGGSVGVMVVGGIVGVPVVGAIDGVPDGMRVGFGVGRAVGACDGILVVGLLVGGGLGAYVGGEEVVRLSTAMPPSVDMAPLLKTASIAGLADVGMSTISTTEPAEIDTSTTSGSSLSFKAISFLIIVVTFLVKVSSCPAIVRYIMVDCIFIRGKIFPISPLWCKQPSRTLPFASLYSTQ